MDLDEEREISDRIGDSTAHEKATTQQPQPVLRPIRAHALAFIELAVTARNYAKSFIPAVYLSAAAVDTAQPLGKGNCEWLAQ